LTKWTEFEDDFVPTVAMPYRNASTYKWVDDSCPVEVLTRNTFCSVLEQLQLSRIMFVGDSITQQMAESLWKLLDHVDDPNDEQLHAKQWMRNVTCRGNGGGFQLSYYRNDHLDGSNFTGDADHVEHICAKPKDGFCTSWIDDYVNNQAATNNTLLIANLGAHIHKTTTFEDEMNAFLSLLNAYQDSSDIVVFRMTVPGHYGCQHATGPLSSYEEFAKTLRVSPRSWHLFGSYNDFGKADVVIVLHTSVSFLTVLDPCVISESKHPKAKPRTNDENNSASGCLSHDHPSPRWASIRTSKVCRLPKR
jgi:hypothetical protein